MIAGYPLASADGFLQQAVQRLQHDGRFKVALEIVALGGFPAPRAPKHLSKRVLAHRPDVVVLQFGSTDASTPLRNGFAVRHFFENDSHTQEKVSAQSPEPFDLIKWQLRNLGSELLLVQPITPLDDYLSAQLDMVNQCLAAGCKVVVISPFVMGSGRCNRFARNYTRTLEQHLPKSQEVHFLDAHTLLSSEPRWKMLLSDSFHLSAAAHQKVGIALGELLTKVASQPAAGPIPRTAYNSVSATR